jgi:hypothetical protein
MATASAAGKFCTIPVNQQHVALKLRRFLSVHSAQRMLKRLRPYAASHKKDKFNEILHRWKQSNARNKQDTQ